jgi:hypothetical protein
MESVWLLLDSGPVGPFGFSWRVAFLLQTPRSDVLDFLGFSRPKRDFQLVKGIKSGKYFHAAFGGGKAVGDETSSGGMRTSRICHGASLA